MVYCDPKEEFLAGYQAGFENPIEIIHRQNNWAWYGFWHGQVDGMASELAKAQGDRINLQQPQQLFQALITKDRKSAGHPRYDYF